IGANEELDTLAAWHWADAEQLAPLNSAGENTPFADLTDIIYYNLPCNVNRFASILKQGIYCCRTYVMFREENSTFKGRLPSRDMFKQVYAWLRTKPEGISQDDRMIQGLSQRSGFSAGSIQFILQVFEQLELIYRSDHRYVCVPSPKKTELS